MDHPSSSRALTVPSTVELLIERFGIDLSPYEPSFLLKILGRKAVNLCHDSLEGYLLAVSRDFGEASALLQAMKIGYSEFFRNPLVFDYLEQITLPRLQEAKAGRGEIRIWSAGCAAGQETYSIGMLLHGMGVEGGIPAPRRRIFGTDISEEELASARLGVYDESALANVRLRDLRSSFVRQGDSYRVSDAVRQGIEFVHHDLAGENSHHPVESIYGDFDIVFCCNLLFYYRSDIQTRILRKVRDSLAVGGFLVTSESERGIIERTGGFREAVPFVPIYCKKEGKIA